MFKKTMKFDNLDGEEVEQTFYFNYNKKEIAELLEFGGLEAKLQLLSMPVQETGLTQQENNQQAYDIFHELILNAYGEKGADNVTFVKNERTREYWGSHVAFVEMIFEFIADPPLAAQFIENCLPAKLVKSAKEELSKENEGKLTSGTLSEMVEEAQRRQADPATRIEPGPEAAREALGSSPAMEQAAQAIAKEQASSQEGPTPVAPSEDKKKGDLTAEDIRAMDDIAFKKLDVKGLSQEALVAAFQRKSG
jgi:hypothetical protein